MGLLDILGQPTDSIWGMINRLPSLFSQQEPPKRIDQPRHDKSAMYPPPKEPQAPQKRDFSFAKDFIQQKGIEGRRDEYYWDGKAFDGEGSVTSGVGHLVPGTKGMINHHLIGQPILAKDVDKQYGKDLQEHGNAGRDFFGREAFDKLPENVQSVLTSLVFNVGKDGIKKYKRMKEAVENFDKESFVDSKGNSRDGGIAGISEELIYSNYNEKPNTFSPRYITTGGRTNMEIMHMLNPSPMQQPPLEISGLSGNFTTEGRPMYHNNFGGESSENSIGVTDPRINNNALTHIPSIYDGKILNQKDAIQKVVDANGYDRLTGRFIEPGGDPEARSKSIVGIPRTESPYKKLMYPPPKQQMQQQQQQMPKRRSLEEVTQTAQVQPALSPFPWLREVSGSYSHPSPPVGRWV